MATSLANARTIEWAGSMDGTDPFFRIYAEGVSETFKRGDLLVYDISEDGLVEMPQGATKGVFGDLGDNGITDAIGLFIGIAQQAASGTTGNQLTVQIPRPQDLFSCIIAATDKTTVSAPVIDDVGSLVDFIKMDTNNNFAVGVLRGTSGISAMIVDIDRADTTFRYGTVGGEPTYSNGDRVIVRFLPSFLSGTGQQA